MTKALLALSAAFAGSFSILNLASAIPPSPPHLQIRKKGVSILERFFSSRIRQLAKSAAQMTPADQTPYYRPRELRTRVVLPVRLCHRGSWSDACILNISSRGLMIHTGSSVELGAQIELRRGQCVIVGRVVWQDAGRAGLQSERCIPNQKIATLGLSGAYPFGASPAERRADPRPNDFRRLGIRAIRFAGVILAAVCAAVAALPMLEAAFLRPLSLMAVSLRL